MEGTGRIYTSRHPDQCIHLPQIMLENVYTGLTVGPITIEIVVIRQDTSRHSRTFPGEANGSGSPRHKSPSGHPEQAERCLGEFWLTVLILYLF